MSGSLVAIFPHCCAMCGKQKARQCKRCKGIRYCSNECQKADWPTHKLLCETFSEFNDSTRPSTDHIRGFLLHDDREKPDLIWLHCPRGEHPREDGVQHENWKARIGESQLGEPSSTLQIHHNPRLDILLSNNIWLVWRANFFAEGSKPNRCVGAITDSYEFYDWRGPLVMYSTHGLKDDDQCRDLDMADFRHVVDFLSIYRSKHQNGLKNHFRSRRINSAGTHLEDPESTDAKSADNTNWEDYLKNFGDSYEAIDLAESYRIDRPCPDTVWGVRINCEGDVEKYGRPKFEAVRVLVTDRVFTGELRRDRWTSEIADRIGIPISTRKYKAKVDWRQRFERTNQEATFLHINCNEKPGEKAGWGWCPVEWQMPCGSVLVVRQDKKPLHPLHAEALSEYCQHRAEPIFQIANERAAEDNPDNPGEKLVKKVALARLTQSDFEKTWEKVLRRNQGGPEVKSPYEASSSTDS
ncbi:uncharacterized protein J3D65DRAFT_428085 [Phyllosticta citribraziliensis]|uniref:MYND-type domain-containing protein n=1 Tax=Phyllosticta citribraziliensis TaxID=989973 RepID=A0ABR1LJJ9_9PEZI